MAAFGVGLGLVPFFLAPDVVNHITEVVIRLLVIRMRICEIVLWKLKDDGNQDEELPDHLFPQISVEGSDLVPVLFDNSMLANIGIRANRFGNVQLVYRKLSTYMYVLMHAGVTLPSPRSL